MIVLEGEVNFLRETPHIKHAYLAFKEEMKKQTGRRKK